MKIVSKSCYGGVVRNSASALVITLLLYCSVVFSAEIYPFNHSEKRQQFNYLTRQFRCLVCQNEDLASSQAELAADLRQQIYTLINQGQNNQQIIDYMKDRYGEFVLFRPPLQRQTWLLWLAPFLLLLLGAIIFVAVIKRAQIRNR